MSHAQLLNQAREARLCGQRERQMAVGCILPLVVIERANAQIRLARKLAQMAREKRTGK
jgi:hypothetical protein